MKKGVEMAKLKKVAYGSPVDKGANTVKLGIEKGIFEKEGLDVAVEVVFGGPEIAAAYDSGALVMGEIGSPPAINAIAAGMNFRIVGSGTRQKAHMYFCVGKGISSYEGLRGKRLGLLGFGSCPDWFARKIMAHHGLDAEKDVEIVPLLDKYPQMLAMMETGELDACLSAEPSTSIGEAKGLYDIWAAGYEEPYLPHFQWVVRVANGDFIEREPDTVAAMLRACRRSVHYAAAHVDEWVGLMVRHYGFDADAARRSVDRELPHYERDCQIDLSGLQRAVDMQYELKGIDRPRKAEELVDLRFQPDLSIAA